MRMLQKQLGRELERSEVLRRQLEASSLPNKEPATPLSHSSSPEYNEVGDAEDRGKSPRYSQKAKPSADSESRKKQTQTKPEVDQMRTIERPSPGHVEKAAVAQRRHPDDGRRHLQFEAHRVNDFPDHLRAMQDRSSDAKSMVPQEAGGNDNKMQQPAVGDVKTPISMAQSRCAPIQPVCL